MEDDKDVYLDAQQDDSIRSERSSGSASVSKQERNKRKKERAKAKRLDARAAGQFAKNTAFEFFTRFPESRLEAISLSSFLALALEVKTRVIKDLKEGSLLGIDQKVEETRCRIFRFTEREYRPGNDAERAAVGKDRPASKVFGHAFVGLTSAEGVNEWTNRIQAASKVKRITIVKTGDDDKRAALTVMLPTTTWQAFGRTSAERGSEFLDFIQLSNPSLPKKGTDVTKDWGSRRKPGFTVLVVRASPLWTENVSKLNLLVVTKLEVFRFELKDEKEEDATLMEVDADPTQEKASMIHVHGAAPATNRSVETPAKIGGVAEEAVDGGKRPRPNFTPSPAGVGIGRGAKGTPKRGRGQRAHSKE